MSADESVILLPLSRHPACLYKNFSLAFTFWIIDETILSPFKRLSILSPKYLTLSVAFITWPLHTTWKLVIFLSFLRGPNNMHSVLPRWRESLLSTSQDEHDSNTFPSLFDITSGFYEGTGWHCHQHTRWVCSHCQYSSTCHWHKLKIKGDQGYYLEGTPHETCPDFDETSFIQTNCFLSDKYDLNQLTDSTPMTFNLSHKISWSTVSNAFCRSNIIIPVNNPFALFPLI